MGSLLNSLVVLTLLFGFIAVAAATAATRPTAVGRFGLNIGGHESQEQFPRPNNDNGLFDGFPFGIWFGKPKPPPGDNEEQPAKDDNKEWPTTNSLGSWVVHSENAGVSAMHIQLMPNNKAVWYDSTGNGISEIQLNPPFCRPRVGGRNTDPQQDCTAHAIEYDVETADIRTLKLDSSPWCSSGGLSRNGNLISTGGDKDGLKAVRILKPCPNCDFEENSRALYSNRWYATQHALEDGRFVVVGGRNYYNYEIVPADTIEFTPQLFELPLLEETNDDGGRENNLYPFVNLLPDGNLFLFANYRSIILNPLTGELIRRLPDLPGGSRNYPPSGMSSLLPIDLNSFDNDENRVEAEVIVCGGNTREAYTFSDLQQPKRTFLPASKDCGRLKVSVKDADWEKEDMPSPRVMGDMLLLPNGDILMINGAKAGTSAWNAAKEPNFTPVLYSPNKKKGQRFKELAPTKIARMYHSVSAVLPDGKILVAGSNTNPYYMLKKYHDHFEFPSELRVEKFSPPYLAQELDTYRLQILEDQSDKKLTYGADFNVEIELKEVEVDEKDIKVTMYSPPFTTHGYSHNQRLLILKVKKLSNGKIKVVAPPSGRIAPPGYYLLFVVHYDVPSRGMWVHIE